MLVESKRGENHRTVSNAIFRFRNSALKNPGAIAVIIFLVAIVVMIGLTYVVAESSSVNQTGPSDSSWSATGNVNFTCNVTLIGINSSIANLSIWTNMTGDPTWELNATNSTDRPVINGTVYNFTLASLPNGVIQWICVAWDNGTSPSANYTNSSRRSVFIDKTAPVIRNAGPTYNTSSSNGAYSSSTTILFNVTVSEPNLASNFNGANVSVFYRRSTGSWDPVTKNVTLVCVATDEIGSNPGYYCNGTKDVSSEVSNGQTLQFYYSNVTDAAGNRASNGSQSAPFNVTIDQTAPVINFINSSNQNNNWSNSRTVTFYVNATESNSTGTCVLWSNMSGSWAKNLTANISSYSSGSLNALQPITFSSSLNATSYLWNIGCNDTAGNSAFLGINYTLRIDSEVPTIKLTSPATSSWNTSNSVAFRFNVTAEANIDTCQLYVNTTSGDSMTANNTILSVTVGTVNATSTTLPDGVYKWNVWCNDSASNTAFNATNFTIGIDTVAPVINWINMSNVTNTISGINYTNVVGVRFYVNATDTNPDTCKVYTNTSSSWDTNLSITSYTTNSINTFTAMNYSQGAHNFSVWCNDSAGASVWFAANYTFVVDTNVSVIKLNSPANNTINTSSTVTFRYTATDLSMNTCQFYINNNSASWAANATNATITSAVQDSVSVTLSDQIYFWNVRCNDSAGNAVFNASNYTLTVDTTSPIISIVSPTDGGYITSGSSVTLNVTLTEQNVNNLVNVTAYYKASGAGSYTLTNLTCINGPPTWSCTKIVNPGLGDTEVMNYYFNTTDSAGLTAMNGSSTVPFSVTVDLSAPNVTAINSSNQNNNWSNSRTVTFYVNATEALNPSMCVLYTNMSGLNNWTKNLTAINVSYSSGVTNTLSPLTFPADGSILWNIGCNDTSGNIAFNPINHTLKIDSAAPALTLLSPGNNTRNSSNDITFRFNVTAEANIGTCQLYLNTTSDAMTANGTNASMTVGQVSSTNASIPNGVYKWNVWCNDSASNTAFSTNNFTLTVDSGTPVINLINSSNKNNNWSTSRTVTFYVNATEAVNPDSCVLWTNMSGGWTKNLTAINTSYASGAMNALSSITFPADGSYLWNIECNDTTGNSAFYSGNWTLKTDSIAPALTLLSPGNNTRNSSNDITFRFNVTAEANIGTCQLYLNTTSDAMTANGTNASMTVGQVSSTNASIPNGVYKWNVWCNDSASNTAFSTNNFTLTVDSGTPVINLINSSNKNNNWSTSRTVTFYVNTTEAENPDTCVLWTNWTTTPTANWTKNLTAINTSYASGAMNALSSITFPADTNILWNIECNDTTGNSAFYSGNWTLKIDSAAPALSLLSPGNNTWNTSNDVTFRFNVTAEANIDTCRAYLNTTSGDAMTANGTNASMTVGQVSSTNASIPNGIYKWNVWCNDSASNTAFSSANYTLKIDATAPTINSINSTVSAAIGGVNYTNSASVMFSVNTTETNPATCAVYTNATSNMVLNWTQNITASYTTDTITSLTAQSFSDGVYKYSLWCNDSAGTTTQFGTNYTLVVDTTNPVVKLNSPANNTWNSSSVTLRFTPTDANVNTCELWMSRPLGASWGLNTTINSPISGTQNATSVTTPAGSGVLWNIRCNDSAGNMVFNSTNFTINIAAAPVVTINNPTSGYGVNSSAFSVSATISDVASAGINTNSLCTAKFKDSAGSIFTLSSSITYNSSSCVGIATMPSGASLGSGNLTVELRDNSNNLGIGNVTINYQTGNYSQALNGLSWNTLNMPSTTIISSMGYNVTGASNLNISTWLTTRGGLGTNYNYVYYNTDGTSSGWKLFDRTDWAGSTLQYINNSNSFPYWINVTSTTGVTFRI